MPDRQLLEVIDGRDRRRIDLDDDGDGLPVGRLDRGRGLGDERRADLRRRPGPRSCPTPIALFGSTVTWTSGVALTRSLCRLARSGWSARPVDDRLGRRGDVGLSWPVTMIRRPFEVNPPPACDLGVEALRLRPASSAAVRRIARWHRRRPRRGAERSSWRCSSRDRAAPTGRPASSCRPRPGCWSGRASTSASASRIVSACDRLIEHGVRAGARRRRDGHRRGASPTPALMNCVGSSGASAVEAKNRIAATPTHARGSSSGCAAPSGWSACSRAPRTSVPARRSRRP